MVVGESTRFGTMSKYANFANSLPMSGEGPVIILMPFLLEENRRHGPERLMVNGRQLVWRMAVAGHSQLDHRDFPMLAPLRHAEGLSENIC